MFRQPPSPEHLKYLKEEMQRRQQFGDVRPIIHATFKGKKVVAVGDQVCMGDWKSFLDFLRSYLPMILSAEWGRAEFSKPLNDRHPIMRRWDAMGHFLQNQKPDDIGVQRFLPDGATTACITLAYDLYTLRHHGALQFDVLKRLKKRDQFFGARYELFVAATCIRAGCSLEFENEKDRSCKHVEFRATHRRTGIVFSVEAKSRQGVNSNRSTRLRVGGLLNDALTKPTTVPFIIFIDVNAPAETGSPFQRRWFSAVKRSLQSCGALNSVNDPFNQIVFTNHPFWSEGLCQASTPPPEAVSLLGTDPRYSMDQSVMLEIQDAADKFGTIPMEFPRDN